MRSKAVRGHGQRVDMVRTLLGLSKVISSFSIEHDYGLFAESLWYRVDTSVDRLGL